MTRAMLLANVVDAAESRLRASAESAGSVGSAGADAPLITYPLMSPPRGLGLWWAVLGGIAVALVLIAAGHVVGGGVLMSLTLGVGAVLRAVVPSRRVGGLVVRSRAFDTAAMLVLAAACLLLAAILKPT